MKRLQHLFPVLLVCYIEMALCGYPTMSDAAREFNIQDAWTITHAHEVMPMGDGTFFVEFTIRGKQNGPDVCYGQYPMIDIPAWDCSSVADQSRQQFQERGKVWRAKTSR